MRYKAVRAWSCGHRRRHRYVEQQGRAGRPRRPAARVPRRRARRRAPGPRHGGDGRGRVVGRVRRDRAAPARGAERRRAGRRRQRHGPVRAARRRGGRAAAPGHPLRHRHPRRPPDRAPGRPLRRRRDPQPLRVGPVLAGGGGQGRVGRRRGAGAVRAGAAAVHAELLPREPADRRVRPGPSLRQPMHAALRLAGPGVVPAVGGRDRRRHRAPAAALARGRGRHGERRGRRGDGAARGHSGDHRDDRRLVGGAQRRRADRQAI